MLRTHTCAELTQDDAGKEVVLCGWVKSRRDHGKLIFVDLRDRYGFTQVVFNPRVSESAYKIAQSIRNEFVLKVKGKVNLRPRGTENPNIPTGKIELEAQEIEILNPSENPPFDIEDNNKEISEELRLKYRYLDLRRRDVLSNFIFRHEILKIIRSFLDKEGFLECSTPFLTKSTPEGARDFLVPSRLNTGTFYALPQSPQLFKQILMVAGIDRYYQIATCFRDEDLRQDRQPEFTQLDIEMSFVEEDDIFNLSERLIQYIFKQIVALDIDIPFRRISYEEAMRRYGTDKPDLRENNQKFSFVWVIDFPLFKYNEQEKRWESEHHPFTAPRQQDLDFLEISPDKVKARSYDLVLNGTEVASGSIRIHQQELQERIFKIIGIPKPEAEKRFGFLLEAFRYGAPPHGGIAFGLERLISILLDKASIREVILFPKTQKGICPLTGAPSEVDERQLKELKIKLDKKE